jgi:hypothetical protein
MKKSTHGARCVVYKRLYIYVGPHLLLANTTGGSPAAPPGAERNVTARDGCLASTRHNKYLVEALCSQISLLSFLGMLVLSMFLQFASWQKLHFTAVPFKAYQTQSICAGTMKFGQHLCQTHTNIQKQCDLNFCPGQLLYSKLCRSCTERKSLA